MTRIGLQKLLKDRRIHLPVIVLVTNADVPVAVRASYLGALDFIEKPLIDRVVVARVKEALALAAYFSAIRPSGVSSLGRFS